MDCQNKGKHNDYRINFNNNGKIISIEVTCCSKHIGEIRFQDGESKVCPVCHTMHSLKLQHNHFHIRPSKPDANEIEPVCAEKKAL
jgi:hypothetical protein